MRINYAKTHEWLKEDKGRYFIGISHYAQNQLGDLVYVNLPQLGDTLTCGKPFCEVESVKASSEIYSPCCGKVIAVNDELMERPQLINEDALAAWIVEVEFKDAKDLLTEEEYFALNGK